MAGCHKARLIMLTRSLSRPGSAQSCQAFLVRLPRGADLVLGTDPENRRGDRLCYPTGAPSARLPCWLLRGLTWAHEG